MNSGFWDESSSRIASLVHGPGAPARQQESPAWAADLRPDQRQILAFHAKTSAKEPRQPDHGAQRQLDPAGLKELQQAFCARASRGTVKRVRPFQRSARWLAAEGSASR